MIVKTNLFYFDKQPVIKFNIILILNTKNQIAFYLVITTCL